MEKLEETLIKINDIVEWYNEIPNDFTGINELINKRRILATNLFFLTSEIGYLLQRIEDSQHRYNEKYDDKVNQYMLMEKSKSMAEVHAKSECNSYLSDVVEWKPIHARLKDQQRAIYEILNAMQQDIAVLRNELSVSRGM